MMTTPKYMFTLLPSFNVKQKVPLLCRSVPGIHFFEMKKKNEREKTVKPSKQISFTKKMDVAQRYHQDENECEEEEVTNQLVIREANMHKDELKEFLSQFGEILFLRSYGLVDRHVVIYSADQGAFHFIQIVSGCMPHLTQTCAAHRGEECKSSVDAKRN